MDQLKINQFLLALLKIFLFGTQYITSDSLCRYIRLFANIHCIVIVTIESMSQIINNILYSFNDMNTKSNIEKYQ
jgi:hypothetical protein